MYLLRDQCNELSKQTHKSCPENIFQPYRWTVKSEQEKKQKNPYNSYLWHISHINRPVHVPPSTKWCSNGMKKKKQIPNKKSRLLVLPTVRKKTTENEEEEEEDEKKERKQDPTLVCIYQQKPKVENSDI